MDSAKPTILSPRVEPLSRKYWWPPLVIGGLTWVVAVLTPSAVAEQLGFAVHIFGVIAVLTGGWLGFLIEDFLWRLCYRRLLWQRIVAAVLLPVFAVATAIPAMIVGALTSLLDGGYLIGFVCAFGWFMGVAAIGTAAVLALDSTVNRFVGGFRRRLVLTVTALAIVGGVAAFGLAAAGPIILQRIVELASSNANITVDLGQGPLTSEELKALQPGQIDLLGVQLSGFLSLFFVPAVASACSKFAAGVMERLEPLKRGLVAVSEGQRRIRVEEAGSADFIEISKNFNYMVENLEMAARMESAFGTYVGDKLLERIREQHGAGTLTPSLRTSTVFFADIRGFTALSERLDPETILGVLNRYFEQVVDVIEAYDGYVDKFIGDAVVAVFNGPADQGDHAARGARCALALQQRIDSLNDAGVFPEVGVLEVGVGVATGPLVAGNLGSVGRVMEYTVIGDTVNLAARLTEHAKAGQVWANQANSLSLPDEIHAVPLPALQVKGKIEAVIPYLLSYDGVNPS